VSESQPIWPTPAKGQLEELGTDPKKGAQRISEKRLSVDQEHQDERKRSAFRGKSKSCSGRRHKSGRRKTATLRLQKRKKCKGFLLETRRRREELSKTARAGESAQIERKQRTSIQTHEERVPAWRRVADHHAAKRKRKREASSSTDTERCNGGGAYCSVNRRERPS